MTPSAPQPAAPAPGTEETTSPHFVTGVPRTQKRACRVDVHWRESAISHVLDILQGRAPEWISLRNLARRLFYRLALDAPQETKERRTKEIIRALRIRRVLIASGPHGYRLDPERKTGRGRRLAQIRSMAETMRAEDAALADSLTRWLDEIGSQG